MRQFHYCTHGLSCSSGDPACVVAPKCNDILLSSMASSQSIAGGAAAPPSPEARASSPQSSIPARVTSDAPRRSSPVERSLSPPSRQEGEVHFNSWQTRNILLVTILSVRTCVPPRTTTEPSSLYLRSTTYSFHARAGFPSPDPLFLPVWCVGACGSSVHRVCDRPTTLQPCCCNYVVLVCTSAYIFLADFQGLGRVNVMPQTDEPGAVPLAAAITTMKTGALKTKGKTMNLA